MTIKIFYGYPAGLAKCHFFQETVSFISLQINLTGISTIEVSTHVHRQTSRQSTRASFQHLQGLRSRCFPWLLFVTCTSPNHFLTHFVEPLCVWGGSLDSSNNRFMSPLNMKSSLLCHRVLVPSFWNSTGRDVRLFAITPSFSMFSHSEKFLPCVHVTTLSLSYLFFHWVYPESCKIWVITLISVTKFLLGSFFFCISISFLGHLNFSDSSLSTVACWPFFTKPL